MIKTEVGGNFIIHERHAAQYYCIYITIGLFQKVKIHPHGRLLLILMVFWIKSHYFPSVLLDH